MGAIGEDSPTYSDWTTGIIFRHVGRPEGAGARISICRYGGPEDLSSCCYGRDNDCNGAVRAALHCAAWAGCRGCRGALQHVLASVVL